MAECPNKPMLEDQLVTTQEKLNLIFDRFWARLAARPNPELHTAKTAKPLTNQRGTTNRPKPSKAQTNLRHRRRRPRTWRPHKPVILQKPDKISGKHRAKRT
ncbi:Hypothetical predicted protein [Pelobates cultripes]|uniref:Uncharacterized protein n=1 Tax=Pelobates cultripes TaxID=61616 RepID=A0AAD1SSM1_PELCU|nr:Hypothetical predicted protein [Pelobates cultripes]